MKPDWCPDDIWQQAEIEAMKYVEWLIPTPTDVDAEHVLAQSFARALVAARAEGRKEGMEEAAHIGYVVCAGTWHATLGDNVAAAIRAKAKHGGK